jgi:hypothetical protein
MAFLGYGPMEPDHPFAGTSISFGKKPTGSSNPQQAEQGNTQEKLDSRDPNRPEDLTKPETEEDGYRMEAIRRLKARQVLRGQPAQTKDSSESQSNSPETTGSISNDSETGKP